MDNIGATQVYAAPISYHVCCTSLGVHGEASFEKWRSRFVESARLLSDCISEGVMQEAKKKCGCVFILGWFRVIMNARLSIQRALAPHHRE